MMSLLTKLSLLGTAAGDLIEAERDVRLLCHLGGTMTTVNV